MKLQSNPKIFLALAGLALVGGGYGSYSQWNATQEISAQSEGLRAQMRNETDVRKDLEDSTKKVTTTAEKLSHLEKGVPQLAYMATLLQELDHAGRDNGIDVLGVRPVVDTRVSMVAQSAGGEVKKRKAYEELNIEVKGRGDYRSVLNFVRALQRFPKIVAARTISITPKTEQGKATKLDITIELRAYLFPQPTLRADRGAEEPHNNG